MTQLNALSFQKNPLEIIKDDDGLWIRSPQIGYALGYKQPRQKMAQLYENNKHEFTSSMTKEMKIKTNSGIQLTRVFSLRGVHLIAMFAKTAISAEFRKWVLNVLENHVDGQKPVAVAAPIPEEQSAMEKTAGAQEDVMMNALKAAYNCLFPVMDNLRAYKDLWETRNILIHSAPRQALALNDALDGLYAAMQEDVQSSYYTLQDMVVGKKPKAKPSIHDFLERSSRHLSLAK